MCDDPLLFEGEEREVLELSAKSPDQNSVENLSATLKQHSKNRHNWQNSEEMWNT